MDEGKKNPLWFLQGDGKKIFAIMLALALVIASVGVIWLVWSDDIDEDVVDDDVQDSDDIDTVTYSFVLPEDNEEITEVSVENDTVTYTYESELDELEYKVGDIIAGTTGFGYLREVIEIEVNDDVVTVHTETASLLDVVDEGSIRVNETLDLNEEYTRSSRTFNLDTTLYEADGTTVEFFGEATISDPQLVFDVDFSLVNGLEYLLFCVEQSYTSTIGIEANHATTIQRDTVLQTYILTPIVVPVGPVPVVLTPRLDIVVGADITLEAGVSTSIDMSMTLRAGVSYYDGEWTPISQVQRSIDHYPPSATLSVEAKGYAALPRFNLLIYGQAGPYTEFQPYILFEASPMENPWWSIYAGVEGNAGVRIEINYYFGSYLVADVKMQVFDVQWLIAEAPIKTVPSAPQNLEASAGDGEVSLSWDTPSDDGGSAITNYRIYRGTTSGNLDLLTTVGNVLTYTDTGLTNGQTYYYRVSAVNDVGEGSRSNEVSATPEADTTVPPAPENLQVSAGDEEVSLSWEAPSSDGDSSITNYRIYRGTSSGDLSLLDTVGNVLEYTDTGLTNEQTYYYAVSAVNEIGEGAMSDEVSATPEADTTVPSAPQNLDAVAGNESVNLTWNPPVNDGGSAITDYNIYRGTTSGDLNFHDTVDTDTTYYNDSGLTNDQTYYYQVSAVNDIGEGALSNEVSATPHDKGEGSGTPEDPYMIHDVHDLQAMNENLTAHYALANDIDASETSGWNGGAGFEPVSDFNNRFTGRFDGRNHIVTGLYINRPSTNNVGLFGYIDTGSRVRNVGVVDVDVSGNRRVGGLVGESNVTVSNSYSTGSVSGDWDVGGLVGSNWEGTVSNSYSTTSVSGNREIGGLVGANNGGKYWFGIGSVWASYATGDVSGVGAVGGLVGYQGDGMVWDSYATGAVSGTGNRVGGLVGANNGGEVSNSYATGIVSGDQAVGGLVGDNQWGMVWDSYATGIVSGDQAVGGLVGDNQWGMVWDSYATGAVSGHEDVGGLIGINTEGTISTSFWDIETSGQSQSDGGNGRNTTWMMTQSTFESAGWDFDNIWKMIDGETYPLLWWQPDP